MQLLAKVKKTHDLEKKGEKRIIVPPSKLVVLSWGTFCPFRDHLTRSGEILGGHNWGWG